MLTNGVGIQLSKGTWRAADIALFEPGQIDISQASNKYINVSPKVVIEIDTKAEVAEISDTLFLLQRKNGAITGFRSRKGHLDFYGFKEDPHCHSKEGVGISRLV